MKHTTFYTYKGEQRIYTTISHSPMHATLRKRDGGTTYRHDDDAALYIVGGMFPLDKPIGKNVKRVGDGQ